MYYSNFSLNIYFYIFIFIISSLIASFCSVVALRLEGNFEENHKKDTKNSSIITGRSMCPFCNAVLPWWTLFPIFSYLILKGKCHNCKNHISVIYPVIELVSGIYGAYLLSNYLTNNINLYTYFLFYFVYFVLLILSIQDIKFGEISDKVAIPAIIILFISQLIYYFKINNFNLFLFQLLIVFILFFLFASIVIFTSAMGGGDIRIFVIMGLVLSFPDILLALTIGFIVASLIGILEAVIKKQKNIAKFHIRLIPYLAFGFSIIATWGNIISNVIFK